MRHIHSILDQKRNFPRLLAAGAAALLAAAAVQAQTFTTVLSSNLFQPTSVTVSQLNRYFISDTANNRIVEFNPDTLAFSVLAGSEAGAADGTGVDARFRTPQGIISLPDGVIVADTGNNLIRKVSYFGVVETIAGNIALAQEADEFGGLPNNGGSADGPALTATFRGPSALTYDGTNKVYIADSGNRSIRVLDLAARTVSTLISSGLNLPSGLALGRDGDLFISDAGTHSIKRWRNGELKVIAGKGSPFDSGYRDSSVATNALFRTPRGIYYRDAKDELIVVDSGNAVLRLITNVSSDSPRVQTFANTGAAGFETPVGIARDAAGIFLVVDTARSSLISVIAVQTPRIADPQVGYIRIVVDPDTGQEFAVLEPVKDQVFQNDVVIAISGEFGAVHHYTEGPGPTNILELDPVPVPTLASPTAPNFAYPAPPSPLPKTLASPLPVLKVKAFSAGREDEERIPSRVVEATFRFIVATPELNSKERPGAIVFRSATENATTWYTLDGSEPVNDTNINPNVFGPMLHGDSIPLVIGTNKLVIKARAYKPNYRESSVAIAEFNPSTFVPNRISLGFEYGEASSQFIAAAGQRFFAPVTLSLLPNATAYSLQFNLSVAPVTGPASGNYGLDFDSMLYEHLGNELYKRIPPRAFKELHPEVTTLFFTNTLDGRIFTNSFTNFIPIFSNMVFINHTEALMGVGWLERRLHTNLYDTRRQDLISFSIPQNTVFRSPAGKVVPGSFSFVIPPTAQDGDTYRVAVGRPSATADGISQDIYIDAPGEDSLSPVKAVRTLRVGTLPYIVGDVLPFRWFNAGDYGDTNIINNDISQIFEAVAYGSPPFGSDFYDAMDSCCVATNGVDLSDVFEAWNGNERIIDSLGFGDGILDISDLYVAMRRSLDPGRVWYTRYWSNGVRHASIVSNMFRGEAAPLTRQRLRALSDPVVETTDRPGLRLSIGSGSALPGQTVVLPITAEVTGGYPLRALLFSVVIDAIEGGVQPGTLEFVPGALGEPTETFNARPGRFSAAWLNTSVEGLLGTHLIGSIVFQVPTEASPLSLYRVRLERVSGSPNGIAKYPVTKAGGAVSMSNRPPSSWPDGISDEWRAEHFGSTTDPLSHALLDADHDGLSNLAEFKLDTNPLDAEDSLRVRASAAAKSLRLRFRTALGRKYILEASDSLEAGSWRVIRPEIIGTGAGFDLNESSDGARLYYRLRLKE